MSWEKRIRLTYHLFFSFKVKCCLDLFGSRVWQIKYNIHGLTFCAGTFNARDVGVVEAADVGVVDDVDVVDVVEVFEVDDLTT